MENGNQCRAEGTHAIQPTLKSPPRDLCCYHYERHECIAQEAERRSSERKDWEHHGNLSGAARTASQARAHASKHRAAARYWIARARHLRTHPPHEETLSPK